MTQSTQLTSLADELAEMLDLMRNQTKLNPSNYDHDQACLLNTQALEIFDVAMDLIPRAVAELRTRPAEARTGGDALRRIAEFALDCGHMLDPREVLAALSHPTPADDARTPDDVVEALGEVKTNIAWAEEHYSGPEFFDVAWPEIRKSLDALNTALTASGDARERDKNAFNHGYLVAISTMLHQHDEPVMAEDALRDSGLQWQAVKALGLDEFDLKVLRPVFRDMERKDALLDTPPAGDGGGV